MSEAKGNDEYLTDVISSVIYSESDVDWVCERNGDRRYHVENAGDVARSILSTPDFQAIKRALRPEAWQIALVMVPPDMQGERASIILRNQGLPDTVIEWVLS